MSMTTEEIAQRVQCGDISLMPDLWDSMRGLICKVANAFYLSRREQCLASGVTVDDLTQEGYLALVDAVSAYDKTRGYKLSAFLTFPLLNRFNSITGSRGNKNPLNFCASLDAPIGDEDGSVLSDVLPDERSSEDYETIENDMAAADLRKALEECLATLESKERAVLELRFFEGKTRSKTAEQSALSVAEVRRFEQSGLLNLRKPKNRNRILSAMESDLVESIGYRRSGYQSFRRTWSSSVELAVLKLECLHTNRTPKKRARTRARANG